MNKFTLDYCKNNKVAIQVSSEEEMNELYTYFTGYSHYQSWSNAIAQKVECFDFNDGSCVWYCHKQWYLDTGYEVITFQQFIKDNKVMKYKIGDRVVPINKTITTSLDISNAWNKSKERGYMYVTRVEDDKYICWYTYPNTGGDHFRESDLIPYVESFVLPEKWCVKRTRNNYKIINDYFNNLGTTESKYSSEEGFIYNCPINHYKQHIYTNIDGFTIGKHEDFTELSFEQFQQFVLKINTMKEKEIIGYKLKEDCKQYEKVAFELAGKNGSKDSWDLIDGYHFTATSTNAQKLKAAGVLDLWFEPVYKEDELKVGDWVIVLKDDDHYGNSEKCPQRINRIDTHGWYSLHFNNGLTNTYKNIRKCTTQEIQNFLIEQAKSKGFVDGLSLNNVISAKGETDFVSCIRNNWDYNLQTDTLCTAGVSIYEKGKWATIKPQKEVVSIGGKFDVEIRDGKIWHKSDDITAFVKELVSLAIGHYTYGGYKAVIKDVTFSSTGCQSKETKLSDWQKVLDVYNKLNK